MASSGTLLSDLNEGGGSMGGGDNDLVKKIFADMNQGSGANPLMPSGAGGSGSMIMAPNPNTLQPMVMDNVPATSHIIGRDHPTPGDFAAAVHGVSRTEVAGMVPPPMPANGMMPQGQFAPYMTQQAPMMMPQIPQKNMYARIADELKTPILVSILVFVFSLPFLNILFSHYAPMLLKPTGDLTSVGLLIKAVAAGSAFWILQRFIAPLVSL
jgi:hypothetical protein